NNNNYNNNNGNNSYGTHNTHHDGNYCNGGSHSYDGNAYNDRNNSYEKFQNNHSSCIITDKDFQMDSPEQTNEDIIYIKPLIYDYNENANKGKNNKYNNDNDCNFIFSNDYYSDYCYQNKEEYKANFIDLTREALALILQDLKKNVIPKIPVGIEKRERYSNSLRLCLKSAKFTKHINELEPYLELFSECIKNSKLPSHMELKDQLFYLDKL
ncbi:transcription factor with AP2 domain(s), putative, partial [Plasmodium malariae]